MVMRREDPIIITPVHIKEERCFGSTRHTEAFLRTWQKEQGLFYHIEEVLRETFEDGRIGLIIRYYEK